MSTSKSEWIVLPISKPEQLPFVIKWARNFLRSKYGKPHPVKMVIWHTETVKKLLTSEIVAKELVKTVKEAEKEFVVKICPVAFQKALEELEKEGKHAKSISELNYEARKPFIKVLKQ